MRVVVADDSTLLREGLVRLLEEAGFDVAGQAVNAQELLQLVRVSQPDVAIVDIRMTSSKIACPIWRTLSMPCAGWRVVSSSSIPTSSPNSLGAAVPRVPWTS